MVVMLSFSSQLVSISYNHHHIMMIHSNNNRRISVLKGIFMTIQAIYIQMIVGQLSITACLPLEFWHSKLILRSSRHSGESKLSLKNVLCRSSQSLFIHLLGLLFHSGPQSFQKQFQIWRIKSQMIAVLPMPWLILRSRRKFH